MFFMSVIIPAKFMHNFCPETLSCHSRPGRGLVRRGKNEAGVNSLRRTIRKLIGVTAALVLLAPCGAARAQGGPRAPSPVQAAQSAMDHDLLEVSVMQLQAYYREHRYTVR